MGSLSYNHSPGKENGTSNLSSVAFTLPEPTQDSVMLKMDNLVARQEEMQHNFDEKMRAVTQMQNQMNVMMSMMRAQNLRVKRQGSNDSIEA